MLRNPLPIAPDRYDKGDQDRTRRLIEQALNAPPPKGTVQLSSVGLVFSNEFTLTAGGGGSTNVALATVQPNPHTWSAAQTFAATVTVNAQLSAATGNVTIDATTAKITFGGSGALADADLGFAGNVGNLNVQARGVVTVVGRSNSASPGTTNPIFQVQAFTTATRTTFFAVREDGQMDLGLGPDWRIVAAGHLIAPTDNAIDIGASAATRPRTGYFGTSLVVATDPGGSASIRSGGQINLNNTLTTASIGSGIYATFVGDSGVADRGGVLLNNSVTPTRHWKMTATFTGGAGTSSRLRAGWVTDVDKETFLNGHPAIEVGPTHNITLGGDLLWSTGQGTVDSTSTRFGGTGTIQGYDVLSYDPGVNKYRPRFLQTNVSTGVLIAGANGDGTFSVFAFDGRTLTGTSIAGPTPTVTAIYGGFIVDMGTTPPANFAWDIEWTNNFNANTGGPVRVTSQKMVFQFFSNNGAVPFGTTATTFQFKVSQTGNTAAVYGTSSAALAASTNTEVNAFGLIVASQIACVNLAAINADMGIIAAGVIANNVVPASQTAGLFIKSTAFESSIPAGWTSAINFSSVAPPSTVQVLLDMHTGLFSVADTQGSPVTRVKVGKVGGATTDYGVQIFDKDAATILDMTGAKRILAVPVQPSVDSGASLTVDLSTGLTQQIRLTNNAATITLQNPTNGARYRMWLQQDTTAGRAFPTFLDSASGQAIVMFSADTPPTLTTGTPGALDLFELEYRTSPTARYTCITLQTNVLLPTPVIDSITTTQVGTASTTHNVNMPATVTAGDLLMILIVHSSTTVPTTPTGWTFQDGLASQGASRLDIYTKVAAGTEGGTTVNVATSDSTKAAAQTYRIHRWFHATSGVKDASANAAASTTPDPPSLTPGFTDRTLWIAVAAFTGNPTISSYPTNYTNNQTLTVDGTAGVGLASANRVLYAATENPGTFTLSSSQNWCAFTIAIEPPA